jgi:hypothetical protein
MENKSPKARGPAAEIEQPFAFTRKQLVVIEMALAKVMVELNTTDQSVALAAMCAKYLRGEIKTKRPEHHTFFF